MSCCPKRPSRATRRTNLASSTQARFTHLRLKIYPDGGVARLRVYGEVVPDQTRLSRARNRPREHCEWRKNFQSSDEFFGEPLNLLLPGPGKNMGDGWETRRRRGPGHDWTIIKLGVPGDNRRVEVDTSHFKGNFPESCLLEGCYANVNVTDTSGADALQDWKELLPRTKLKAHSRHAFRQEVADIGPVTHVRLNIYPDGGVSRLRLFGKPARQSHPKGIALLNDLSAKDARKAFLDCCGSVKWAQSNAGLRPFTSAEELLGSC